MQVTEFNTYAYLLEQGPFALYPAPKGFNDNKFIYVTHDQTHVRLQHISSQREYALPLVLVEFANPGVLRLTRDVAPFNGSFV